MHDDVELDFYRFDRPTDLAAGAELARAALFAALAAAPRTTVLASGSAAGGAAFALRACREMYSRSAVSIVAARRCFSPAISSICLISDSSIINGIRIL